MAAIDYRGLDFPSTKTQSGVGTTWQEFRISADADLVTISADGAVYIAWNDATDEGAVGANRYALSATDAPGGREYQTGAQENAAGSVFVAAQSGTVAVTIEQERVS